VPCPQLTKSSFAFGRTGHASTRIIFGAYALSKATQVEADRVIIVDDPDKLEYFLWRLMIAEPFHGRGYGRQAIQRLVEYVKTRPNAKELLVSCGQGAGSPEGFYLRQGFVSTGKIDHDELVLQMPLA
jgi:GNAT superfamily N-acetyltransferase